MLAGYFNEVFLFCFLELRNIPELENFERGGHEGSAVSRKRATVYGSCMRDTGVFFKSWRVDQIDLVRCSDCNQAIGWVKCQRNCALFVDNLWVGKFSICLFPNLDLAC